MEVGNFKVLIIIPENGTMTTVFEKPKKISDTTSSWSLKPLPPLTHRTITTTIIIGIETIQLNHHARELVANDGGDGSDDGNDGSNGGDGRGRKIGSWLGRFTATSCGGSYGNNNRGVW